MSTHEKRRGFSLVEISVAGALVLTISGIACAFSGGAARSAHFTQTSSDSTRAILLAAEHIGLDLRRAVIEKDSDLVIETGGHRATFAMATAPYANWGSYIDRVTYELEPGTGPRKLMRRDGSGVKKLHACVLSDLVFQLRPESKKTPWRRTVLVTLVAATGEKKFRAVSVEIPVSRAVAPPAYPWKTAGGAP